MSEKYSSLVGLIYLFNLIVGTGALTLPAVFAGAGWILSTILIVFLALISFITATFIVETMACANATIHWQRVQSHKVDESEAAPGSDTDTTDDSIERIDGSADVNDDSDDFYPQSSSEETAIVRQPMRLHKRHFNLTTKVELGEMTTLYFNRLGRALFYVSLCTYLYGDLAIYTTAVSKTLVDITCTRDNTTYDNYDSLCNSSSTQEEEGMHKIDVYRIYVSAFALTVAPFTYFNVKKTMYLQVFTTALRWSAFLVMITLASVRIISDSSGKGAPQYASIDGVPGLVGASVYSFMCHHSIPGLVTPIADKQHLTRKLGVDYAAIASFYLLLALTGSFAFAHLEDLYTLNFAPVNGVSWFRECVNYFLSAFPLFTLSTSFPIIAITLQNNLKSLFLNVHENDGHIPYRLRYGFFVRRLVFPTLAVVPPVLVALSTHNLRTLVAVTGSYAGVLIQYVIPACLVREARYRCRRDFSTVHLPNRYQSPFRGAFWYWLVMGWALMCVCFVTANFVISEMGILK